MNKIKIGLICILLFFSGCQSTNKSEENYEYINNFDLINSLATDIKSADINSDGLIDIIVATAKIPENDIFTNNESENPLSSLYHEDHNKEKRINRLQETDYDKININQKFIGKNEIIIYINKGSWNFNDIHIPIKGGMGATGELSIQDVDLDGDLDIIVGILGDIRVSTIKKTGGVIIIENKLNENYQTFKSHIIAKNLSRVVKAFAKDLDKDGDEDLIVAAFGSGGEAEANGNIYLLINKDKKWNFETIILSDLKGSLDIVDISSIVKNEYPILGVLISEDHEKIISFNFENISKIDEDEIYSINNPEWGSLRLEISDLDKDGDEDLIWINGDSEESEINELHGISWIEQENGRFTKFHEIGKLPMATNGIPVDYDNDGDIDIITSQMFINFEIFEPRPGESRGRLVEDTKDLKSEPHIGFYRNKGNGSFFDYEVLAKNLLTIMVMSTGDYDNDGDIDISYQDIISFNLSILENNLI